MSFGCGALVLVCGGLAVSIALLVTGLIRRSDAYQQALADVRESPAIVQALGEPLEPGWWLTGSIETSGDSGEARFTFPVAGPRGEARVFVEATRRARRWHYQLLEVELPSGERVDLLEEEGPGPFDVVSDFIAHCSRAEYSEAHALFSAALVEVQPLEEFRRSAAGAAGLFEVAQVRLERTRSPTGTHLEGTLLLADGREIDAAFELVREQDAWRLVSYQLGKDEGGP